VRGSPAPSSNASRSSWLASSAASAAIGVFGRAMASSAATRNASGSRAHSSASRPTAPGSASARPPISVVSSAITSGKGSRSRSRRRAPSRATSPAKESRLVTTTTTITDPLPGSSGRTCSSLAALSSTTRAPAVASAATAVRQPFISGQQPSRR
jgi:hypothetical protein